MESRLVHILHVIPQIGVGGAERQLYKLISKSESSSFSHEILYYSDSNDNKGFEICDKLGIKYTRVDRDKKHPVIFLRGLAKEIKKRDPDVVHCWLYSGVIWGRWAAILAGVKNVIVAYRSSSLANKFILRMLEKFTSKKVEYLANSKACAAAVAKVLAVPVNRFNVIYNGIDVTKRDGRKIPCLREELKIQKDISIVTMVGRLTYAKNYPMLIRLAAKCKLEGLPVCFLLVGHGELEDEHKQLAVQLDVTDTVHFLGLRDDVDDILSESDLFCYTSFYEGFPNALLEAMLAELPIIATRFDGVKELISDGINGKLVDIDDVDAMCSGLKYYLNNPTMSKQFAGNACSAVQQKFSMAKMVNSTEELYTDMLRENIE